MTILEQIEIMKAYADGKQIEFIANHGEWLEVSNPTWNWETTTYRIKPDEPEFKVGDWVVFRTQEEIPIVCKLISILGGVCTVKGLHPYKVNMSDILSLWQPQEGELVVCNYRNGRCVIEPYYPNDTDYYTVQPLIYDFTIYK